MKSETRIGSGILGLTMAAAMVGAIFTASAANAHGFVDGDIMGRAGACKIGLNHDCGGVEYEPQSIEAPKGFPSAGPADGQIASGGGKFQGKLDEQSPTRWYHNEINSGPNQITWNYTAPHLTSGWHYYMTPQGWDQNAPLNRAELEQIGTISHDGSAASSNPTHTINVPSDRTGYHVILAVWDVADTSNAFYNTIDVDVVGGASDVVAPESPSGLAVTNVGSSTATLSWKVPAGSAVVDYQIVRNGEVVATTTATSYEDRTLSPSSDYAYQVIARNSAGSSPASAKLVVNTTEKRRDEVAAPTNLHSMGETTNSVNLMWFAPTDASNIVGYQIYRDGTLVGSTAKKMYLDSDLPADATYRYEVRAIDAAGNKSAASNELSAKTKSNNPGYPEWNTKGSYKKGDLVSYQGHTYEAIQAYTGHGDPGWIAAPSLWKIVD